MREVLPLATRLPDTIVRFTPMMADVAAKVAQHPLRFTVQAAPAPQEMRHRFNHLAVNIQLQLVTGRVSDPYRARSRIAAQMSQLAFFVHRSAVYIVCDSQLWASEAR